MLLYNYVQNNYVAIKKQKMLKYNKSYLITNKNNV